jgi:hypothetical protein
VAHAFPTFAGEVPLTEYGTHEGVPNRLYFVPHAKVGGRPGAPCSPCAAAVAGQWLAMPARLLLVPALPVPLPASWHCRFPAPNWLQALVFFRSVKAGLLLGVEQGQGFVIARLAPSGGTRRVQHLAAIMPPDPQLSDLLRPACLLAAPACRVGGATSNRWSAPAFVRVTGVGFGLVAGMDRVSAARVCARCCSASVALLLAPLISARPAAECFWQAEAARGQHRQSVQQRRAFATLHETRYPCSSLRLAALQAETLVGVMSNRALDALINSKGKFTMSSNW